MDQYGKARDDQASPLRLFIFLFFFPGLYLMGQSILWMIQLLQS